MFKLNKLLKLITIGLMFLAGVSSASPQINPGAQILRIDDTELVVIVDQAKGLAASVGGDLLKFCNGGGEDLTTWTVQAVINPSDIISYSVLAKANDSKTFIWEFVGVNVCSDLLNFPIATGTTDVVFTDNDRAYANHKNANAWGFSAHGVLEKLSGERKRANIQFKCLSLKGDGSCRATIGFK